MGYPFLHEYTSPNECELNQAPGMTKRATTALDQCKSWSHDLTNRTNTGNRPVAPPENGAGQCRTRLTSEPCALRTFRVQNFHWKLLRLNLARKFFVLDSGAERKLD